VLAVGTRRQAASTRMHLSISISRELASSESWNFQFLRI